MFPQDLRYTDDHEWARPEGEVAAIGITGFATERLNDLVYVELPSVGDSVEKGAPFGVVESVKTAADLLAPVSGEVVEVHAALVDQLDVISQDPYGEGWLIKVAMSDPTELDQLLDHEQYAHTVAAEQEQGP